MEPGRALIESGQPSAAPDWPLIAIVGPTASAKSALALKLAEELNGEVLNCDSVQIYRGLDIGSGKVPAEWRQRVPHHLLDVVGPEDLFSAGDYRREAEKALHEVRARKNLPIVVGGTGLYLRALVDGLFDSPGRSEELRQRLRRLAQRRGRPFLHRMLRRRDPAVAQDMDPNDVQKIIRALEICLISGRATSNLYADGKRPLKMFHPIVIGLSPPRARLWERINLRVENMFASGLLDEVKNLLESGCSPSAKALGALGYRQACGVLEGSLSVAEAVEFTQRGTRRYAKRQLTWFRRQTKPSWFEGFGDSPSLQRQVMDWLAGQLGSFPRYARPPVFQPWEEKKESSWPRKYLR